MEYEISAVVICRIEATADDSLAEMRERRKFGIAMAAMIRMIATTINNSISENPPCLRFMFSLMSAYAEKTAYRGMCKTAGGVADGEGKQDYIRELAGVQ